VSTEAIPVLPGAVQSITAAGRAHSLLRIFQVFVNVDGLRIRGRRLFGLIPLPSWKRYGFYAVMPIAADEESKPPLLLALARDALVDEFSSLTPTSPDSWSVHMVDWRMVAAAPPLIQQPGCVDNDWGAAWYESTDEKAKQHRYRLVKLRLWKGKRAKKRPSEKQFAVRASTVGGRI
jgi:hypothetical protein